MHKRYNEVNEDVGISSLEEGILAFWEQNKIFEKSIEQNRPPFVFYEGPPTANGRPGVHHIQSRTLKDIICRYKTMKGFKVERKGGWDTHGLPVEIEVEKEIGIKDKEEIEKYGIDKFNEKCRNSVFTYKSEWEKITKRTAFWVDLNKPYVTLDNDYIESVWWGLNQIYNKGLLYKGFKITPYCPRCGTSLSSHEVAMGYKEVKDLSVYVKMKLVDEDAYFLVWTTTPWTLISNVAVSVNPQKEYVKIEVINEKTAEKEKLILAKERLSVITGEYVVLETFIGKELEKKRYNRLFDYVEVKEHAFYVTTADFVTMDDGTGIVHIAPAFGEDDYRVGVEYSLPIIKPVDDMGEYTQEVVDFKGRFVKDCDVDIMKMLAERGQLYKKEKYSHNYPHCWRCSTPLIYYAKDSWYIKVTEFKEKLISNNSMVNWFPKEIGIGRFGKWLENLMDWGISRNRYWGTPLNIWVCEKCEATRSVGSKKELFEEAIEKPSKDDLHRPYVDEVVFKCNCGGKMKRVTDVVDVWLDSGSMPFAQFHYPFENKKEFESRFPADFISEGIDQTRGWFYSLIAISTLLFGKSPYKNVLVTDLILDKNGQKMSKSKGNAVDPWDIIKNEGSDALRYYLMSVSPPWIPTKFDRSGVVESLGVIKTVINTYSFFSMYANIDNFEYSHELESKVVLNKFDKWILSSCNSMVIEVDSFLSNYDIHKALKSITLFINDYLSNWYVRRNRRRFWRSGESEDKMAAYYTLYTVLIRLSHVLAPFVPFIAEWLYKNLNGEKVFFKESIHLCQFPSSGLVTDKKLESEMECVLTIVNLARSIRSKTMIKVRQPLNVLNIALSDKSQSSVVMDMKDIILDELNVKNINIIESDSDMMEPVIAPDFRVLGKKLGTKMGKVSQIVKSMDSNLATKVVKEKKLVIDVDGEEIVIHIDELEIKWVAKKDLILEENNGISVGLDVKITDDLRQEGMARDIVNRIQKTRKDNGFDVIDRIETIVFTKDEFVRKSCENFEDYIKKETLSKKLYILDVEDVRLKDAKEWKIEDEIVYIKLYK